MKEGTKLSKGQVVECTGIAYVHNAPVDGIGLIGPVTRVEEDLVYFDSESRGEVAAPFKSLKKAKVKK